MSESAAQTVTVTEVIRNFGGVLDRLNDGLMAITRDGKIVAWLAPHIDRSQPILFPYELKEGFAK